MFATYVTLLSKHNRKQIGTTKQLQQIFVTSITKYPIQEAIFFSLSKNIIRLQLSEMLTEATPSSVPKTTLKKKKPVHIKKPVRSFTKTINHLSLDLTGNRMRCRCRKNS